MEWNWFRPLLKKQEFAGGPVDTKKSSEKTGYKNPLVVDAYEEMEHMICFFACYKKGSLQLQSPPYAMH